MSIYKYNADRLKGRDISSDSPSDGDVLVWNESESRWEPKHRNVARLDQENTFLENQHFDEQVSISTDRELGRTTIQAPEIVTGDSYIEDYGLVITHEDNEDGGDTSGIAFHVSSNGSPSTTPGAAITHQRTDGWSHGDLSIWTKPSTDQTGSLERRFRVKADGTVEVLDGPLNVDGNDVLYDNKGIQGEPVSSESPSEASSLVYASNEWAVIREGTGAIWTQSPPEQFTLSDSDFSAIDIPTTGSAVGVVSRPTDGKLEIEVIGRYYIDISVVISDDTDREIRLAVGVNGSPAESHWVERYPHFGKTTGDVPTTARVSGVLVVESGVPHQLEAVIGDWKGGGGQVDIESFRFSVVKML